jgi:outer membrane biosynthesis protein TonB
VTKIARRVLVFLLLVGAVGGQDIPKPELVSAQLPRYPARARAARVERDVKIEFVLNSSGEPVSVTAVSGHPFLKAAAEDNVQSWRF